LLSAFEQLQKLAEAQPDNEGIFVRMANVAYMMEDYGAMADACEKALLINKDDPEVLGLYARACIGQGDQVNAVAMLTKAISLKEDYLDAYLLRGDTLLKMGELKGAGEDADYLLQQVKDNEDVLLLKARVVEAKGEHDAAIDIYNKVIEADPFSLAAFKERGAIKLAKGDKEGAEEDMKAVLELDPDKSKEVSGEYNAEGTEDIQRKVEEAYKNNNPFGLG
jgi:tetratricopeptide (TPR) repeat protein